MTEHGLDTGRRDAGTRNGNRIQNNGREHAMIFNIDSRMSVSCRRNPSGSVSYIVTECDRDEDGAPRRRIARVFHGAGSRNLAYAYVSGVRDARKAAMARNV